MPTTDFERGMQQYIQERRRQDRIEEFVQSWRILCDGKVIEHTPARHGDYAERSCRDFLEHIKSALKDDEWDWEGYGGRMTAKEWLAHHEGRFGMPLTENLELVPPGKKYPLCPGLQSE